jgi:hypothetical protein
MCFNKFEKICSHFIKISKFGNFVITRVINMRIKIWIKLIVTSRAYTGRNLSMIPAEQVLLLI